MNAAPPGKRKGRPGEEAAPQRNDGQVSNYHKATGAATDHYAVIAYAGLKTVVRIAPPLPEEDLDTVWHCYPAARAHAEDLARLLGLKIDDRCGGRSDG